MKSIAHRLALVACLVFIGLTQSHAQQYLRESSTTNRQYQTLNNQRVSDELDSLVKTLNWVEDTLDHILQVQAYQAISISTGSLQISGNSLMDSLTVMTFGEFGGDLEIGGDLSVSGDVSGITATMVGLGNVDNTADADKPVSSATQSALDLKAPLASPTFTGTPSLPTGTTAVTQAADDNSTKLATTAYVDAAVNSAGSATQEILQEVTVSSNGTTAFTLSQTPAATSVVRMYRNGILLSGLAYTVSATEVTYLPANNGNAGLEAGDRIQFFYAY